MPELRKPLGDYFFIFLIITIGVVTYVNSFGNKFVYDDFTHIVHNPDIKNLNNLTRFFTDYTTSTTSKEMSGKIYRPIQTLSFAIDYVIWKLNPLFYHIENVSIHILNAILLYFIMKILLRDTARSVFISLLFLTHPVQTEVVDWISHRADALGLFFYLSAFVMHLKIRDPNHKSVMLYPAITLFYLISLLCKETMITLPVILFITDIFLLRNNTKIRLKGYFWYYLPFFIIILCYLFLRMSVLPKVFHFDFDKYIEPPSFPRMCSSFFRYILLLVFPTNLSLEHEEKAISAFLSLGLLGSIFAAAYFLRNYAKLFTFGICWFFITLLPVSGFSMHNFISDRHLYLPSIGFFVAIVALIIKQREQIRKYLYYLLCIMIAIYMVLTMYRNRDWKDNHSIFKATAKASPTIARISYWLGKSYYEKGMKEEAIAELNRTIKIDFRHSYKPYVALGDIYYKEGELEKAIEYYSDAMKLGFNPEMGYYKIGRSFYMMGDMPAAIEYYKKAIALNKNRAQAHFDLASAYLKDGQTQNAIDELEITVKIDPGYPRAQEFLQKLKENAYP